MSRFDAIEPETLEQFNEVAADLAARSFQFMKPYVTRPNGPLDWKAGNVVTTNEEALALPDYAAMGHTFFENNKPVDLDWVLILGNKRPPRPNILTDRTKWGTWSDGRPRDPLSFRTRMPFKLATGELAGKIVLFNGENEAGRYAISSILAAFAEKRRRPLVLLTSAKRDGEHIYDPVFQIIRFTEDDTAIPGLSLAKHSTVADEPQADDPPVQVNGGDRDLDDEIPF